MSYGLASLPVRRFQTGGATASGAPAGFFSDEAEQGFASMMTAEAVANMQAQAEAQAEANAQADAQAQAMGFADAAAQAAAQASQASQAAQNAPDTSPAIGLMGLTSPAFSIGPVSVTPMDMMSLAVPALAPVNTAINAINALAAMNQTQAPAPVTEAVQMDPAAIVAEAEAAQAEAVAAQQAAVDAQEAMEGLAAMNAQAEAEANQAEAVAATQAAVDAAEAAVGADAAAAAAEGAAGDAGAAAGGGNDGPGPSDGSPGTSAGPSGDGDGGGGGGEGERAGGIISMRHRYAQGGMPDVARHVQSQGRGQDKMLVHMTPQEVQGLQYLAMRHGGSLTVNPETGLVEAGFLSSILPMIAGVALAPLTAGTSLAFLGTPMGAALTVGGITGLATGSLKKGLMAGLGAFGGAGLGSALGAAGAAVEPLATGTTAGLTSAGEMAASNLLPEAAQAASYGDVVGAGMQSPYFQAAQSNIDPALLEGMSAQQVSTAPVLNATPGVMPPAPSFEQGFGRMGEGIKNIVGMGTPEDANLARTAFMKDVGGVPGLISKAGSAAAPVLSGGFEEPPPIEKGQAYIRPFKYDIGRQDVPYRTGERGESTSEQRYFSPSFTPVGVYKAGEEPVYGTYAEGGGVGFDDQLNMDVGGLASYSDTFYGGGLTALAAGGKTLPPRYLEGDGDGMSDSIKARIGGVQEARLADGEFVIPADVVSHIGNGSSNAGAKKLHDMMDRIRKARTGKKRQAPEVKTERLMPA